MGWGKQWSKPWSVVDNTDKLETPFCFGKVTCKVVLLLFSHPVMSDCDLRDLSKLRPPVPHHPLKFAQVHVHCISDQPSAISSFDTLFSFCPQSYPASGTFPMSQLFASGDQNTGVSASAFSPSYEYSGLISFKIDWFDLLAVQGLSQESSLAPQFEGNNSWCSDFFIVQLSQLYVTTGKTIVLTFVSRVMSLLFNTLPGFVIAFLPRSNCHLISWLQSPSIVILEPKKRKSVTASTFPLIFAMK